MRIPLDTHAYFWWETIHGNLSPRARDGIAAVNNEVPVSAVTAWELATRRDSVNSRKLPMSLPILRTRLQPMRSSRFRFPGTRTPGFLPSPHRDPFDRMLAAQAQVEGIPLVTADPVFRAFGVRVLW
jgi:PIN domain nuclease of toxin-antitoxin system